MAGPNQRPRRKTASWVDEVPARHVEHAAVDHPECDVAPTVTAWEPADATGREIDRPATQDEILGDLPAGRTAPDHQRRAAGHRGRVPVFGRVQLAQMQRQQSGQRWPARLVQIAAGDDHIAGKHRTAGRGDPVGPECARVSGELEHWACRFHRQVVALGEGPEQGHELVPSHEAFRVRPVVVAVRHDSLGVGQIHPESIPALGPPGLADAAALQHTVAQAGLRKEVADPEPSPAGTDDHRVQRLAGLSHWRILPSRSTARGRISETITRHGPARQCELPSGFGGSLLPAELGLDLELTSSPTAGTRLVSPNSERFSVPVAAKPSV